MPDADAPARRAAPLTVEQEFLAKHTGASAATREALPDENGDFANAAKAAGLEIDPARNFVERVGAGRVVMYRPGPFGSQPVIISTNAISQCFAAGWTSACKDCGLPTCGVNADGTLDPNPNACAGKANVMLRRCPICQKRIYDLDTTTDRGEKDDPNEIRDDVFAEVTPETRTRARLEQHLIYYHENEARQYGLSRPQVTLAQAV